MSMREQTPGQHAAFAALTRVVCDDAANYPNDLVFVPSDIPSAGALLREHIGEGLPVVIVAPDGGETLVVPRPRTFVMGWIDRRIRRRVRVSVRTSGSIPTELELTSSVSTRHVRSDAASAPRPAHA